MLWNGWELMSSFGFHYTNLKYCNGKRLLHFDQLSVLSHTHKNRNPNEKAQSLINYSHVKTNGSCRVFAIAMIDKNTFYW